MGTQTLRLRTVISDNLAVVLLICLGVALVGGYLTYTTHIEPGVQTEEFEETSWSSTAEFTHSATVTTETPVFPEGIVLRDRAAYLTSVTPAVNGTLEYVYRATDGGGLDVQSEQQVVLRSVGEQEGGRVEYWQTEKALATTSETAVTPGETVEIPVSLNVSEQLATADEIEAQLGGTPGSTELLVVSEISVSGTRNGEQVDETYVYEIPMSVDSNVYQFGDTGPYEESGETRGQRTVDVTHGPLRSVAGPVLVAVGLLGGLGITIGRLRGGLVVSQVEREWLAYRTTYNEFEEWISPGRVEDDAPPSTRVRLDSLDGLVDVAIDSNRRVIYDRQRGSHTVRLGETVYTYDPPVRPASVSQSDMRPLASAGETTQTPAPDEATKRDTAPSEPQPSASDTDDSGGEPEQNRTDETTRADDDAERP